MAGLWQCSNEANEQAYIKLQVLQKLQNAGVLEYNKPSGLDGRDRLLNYFTYDLNSFYLEFVRTTLAPSS